MSPDMNFDEISDARKWNLLEQFGVVIDFIHSSGAYGQLCSYARTVADAEIAAASRRSPGNDDDNENYRPTGFG